MAFEGRWRAEPAGVRTGRRARAMERIDPLTGLATRPVMLERLVHAVDSSARHGKRVGVIDLDLDSFGEVNERFRHDVGDHVLIEIARRLSSLGRRTDHVCRLGRDEFVLVAEHLDGTTGAAVVADRVVTAIREPVHVGRFTIRVTASVGVAVGPDDSSVPHDLVRLARSATNAAREAGGDTYRLSRIDLRDEDIRTQATLADLRRAVDAGDLDLAYQPQIDLRTGRIVAAEGLLRWRRDRTESPITASQFIALTENTELAERIGLGVIDVAVGQLAEWHAAAPTERLTVTVNVSRRHLRGTRLVRDVRDCLSRHGASPRYLELEIPEVAFAEDLDHIMPTLRELRALGVKLTLDDFGSGSVSLRRLPDLPIHALKLDASLGDRLAGRGAGLVAGLVGLGRELGLQVIIPRIEHSGQLRRARQLGCHRAQGYLISPPVPPGRLLNSSVAVPAGLRSAVAALE